MMKSEFESRIGKTVPHADYQIIEHVYNWHPAIDDKDQIAAIYKAGGMAVIRDMLKTANHAKELRTRETRLADSLRAIREELDKMKRGEEYDG